jgi:hypothetical protein
MKKIRGDEPTGVIIPIYIEIPQGNSLWNYLYLRQTKMSFFFFSFFFYKIGVGISRSGEVARKGGTRVNMVQKMCKPLK